MRDALSRFWLRARRKSRGLVILSKGPFDNAMGQNSCQPEGLQPESAMAALLVLPIERLLPSPGALPSPILAATHTCFIMLGTLRFPDIELSMPAAWRNLIVANASAHRRLIPMLHDGAESVQP